jgi:glucokinase
VAEAAAAGDPLGRELFEEAGTYLGMALTSYLHVFGPDVIVLGGGVSLAGALLTDPVARTMRRLASPGYFDHLSGIELSSLGKDSAAVGCASLVLFPGEHLTGMRATQASA